jgi:hypothetical protein
LVLFFVFGFVFGFRISNFKFQISNVKEPHPKWGGAAAGDAGRFSRMRAADGKTLNSVARIRELFLL